MLHLPDDVLPLPPVPKGDRDVTTDVYVSDEGTLACVARLVGKLGDGVRPYQASISTVHCTATAICHKIVYVRLL